MLDDTLQRMEQAEYYLGDVRIESKRQNSEICYLVEDLYVRVVMLVERGQVKKYTMVQI